VNAPFLRPRGCPIGIDLATWREAIATRLEQLSEAMAALVAALDQMDGDADFELNGDEFDFSAPESWRPFDTSLLDDSEDYEDDGTTEPILGAPETVVTPPFWSSSTHRTPEGEQTHWAAGSNRIRLDDAEAENEHGGNILDEPHLYDLADQWRQTRT
jgi:hypothetical protein